MFLKSLMVAFADLCGIVCVTDDVFIHWKTQEEYNENTSKFLQCSKELGGRLNKHTMVSFASEITFMEHSITEKWVQINSEKVWEVIDLDEPHNVEELRNFLGMVKYVSKFLPNLIAELHPLHNLLWKDASWNWLETQRTSFLKMKKAWRKPQFLYSMSQIGLPFSKMVPAYMVSDLSCSRTVAQWHIQLKFIKNWIQIRLKREGNVGNHIWTRKVSPLEKFHHFTYWREVKVIIDHKPLVATIKVQYMTPQRLQNQLLKAMNYSAPTA